MTPEMIIEYAQKALAALAGLGIIIDLTPGIKFQPVRYLLRKLGSLLNHDIKEQLDTLQSQFTQHQIESWRHEILAFANSCMNHTKHTKEEFDYIIKIHTDYVTYITKHKIQNGQIDIAYKYISDIYIHLMETNGFLSGKAKEDKEED